MFEPLPFNSLFEFPCVVALVNVCYADVPLVLPLAVSARTPAAGTATPASDAAATPASPSRISNNPRNGDGALGFAPTKFSSRLGAPRPSSTSIILGSGAAVPQPFNAACAQRALPRSASMMTLLIRPRPPDCPATPTLPSRAQLYCFKTLPPRSLAMPILMCMTDPPRSSVMTALQVGRRCTATQRR